MKPLRAKAIIGLNTCTAALYLSLDILIWFFWVISAWNTAICSRDESTAFLDSDWHWHFTERYKSSDWQPTGYSRWFEMQWNQESPIFVHRLDAKVGFPQFQIQGNFVMWLKQIAGSELLKLGCHSGIIYMFQGQDLRGRGWAKGGQGAEGQLIWDDMTLGTICAFCCLNLGGASKGLEQAQRMKTWKGNLNF